MRWRSRPAPASGRCCRPGVAELIAPGRYRLSRLLRGQRGTEGAIGSPAPAGARVVVLDEALAPLPVPEAALGLEANWRFGPASKPVADRSYRQLGFTPEGVGLRPFSVVHVRQPWRTAREPGDLVIAWTRRSRALAADSWTAAEAPLAEEREAYEVEVLDGAAVVRTLATTTTSVTYTAAQQLADLGALLGPGDTLLDPHLPALRPRRAGRAGLRHPRVLILMPDTSTHLLLPYLLAAQAQKHVTVNEALRLLDGLVQLAVLDRHLTAPPASPADGARYIVASGATGAWAGWDLNVAYRVDGAWMRLVPRPGWQAWVVDEASFLAWDGSAWNAAGLPAFFSDAVFQLAHDADSDPTGDLRPGRDRRGRDADLRAARRLDRTRRPLRRADLRRRQDLLGRARGDRSGGDDRHRVRNRDLRRRHRRDRFRRHQDGEHWRRRRRRAPTPSSTSARPRPAPTARRWSTRRQ